MQLRSYCLRDGKCVGHIRTWYMSSLTTSLLKLRWLDQSVKPLSGRSLVRLPLGGSENSFSEKFDLRTLSFFTRTTVLSIDTIFLPLFYFQFRQASVLYSLYLGPAGVTSSFSCLKLPCYTLKFSFLFFIYFPQL